MTARFHETRPRVSSAVYEHPRQQEHQGHLPGHHRLGGRVSYEGLPGIRHENGRRGHAGQGGAEGREWIADF